MLASLRSTPVRILACTLALLALTIPACVFAQTTINVGPGKTYTTIQAGIDAVERRRHRPRSSRHLLRKHRLQGQGYRRHQFGGPSATIIDGGKGQNPAVVFGNGESNSSVLNGFTIQNGGIERLPTASQ